MENWRKMYRKIDLGENLTKHTVTGIKETELMKKPFSTAILSPFNCLPVKELRKEWAKSHLPAILRTNPQKESSTIKTLRNKEQKTKLWFQ